MRAVDYHTPRYGRVECDEKNWECDLRLLQNAYEAAWGVDEIWALAADMGGMSFVLSNHSRILQNNALINLNTANAARDRGIGRLFYSSSACVYPEDLQTSMDVRPLRESDAWKGKPDTAYGIEKLFAEEVYLRLAEETGCQIRIARFHNIYGPEGAWTGGREKAPAWLCRMAAEQKLGLGGEFKLHGDGTQTRSFCYIDDCLELIYRLMYNDCTEPLNVGSDRLVSINDLAAIAMDAAGISAKIHYDALGPVGVRGRNADLEEMRHVLGYEPRVSLEEGMSRTYEWIEGQMKLAVGVY